MRLSVTIMDSLSVELQAAIKEAKENISDLEVNVFCAPKGTDYSVPFPFVLLEAENIITREYGADGLALIKDIAQKKIC